MAPLPQAPVVSTANTTDSRCDAFTCSPLWGGHDPLRWGFQRIAGIDMLVAQGRRGQDGLIRRSLTMALTPMMTDQDDAVAGIHHHSPKKPENEHPLFTGPGALHPPNGLSARALERTHAYIAQHLCESFSLDDLARVACISRFHFARLFRASTGNSPMEYVLKARMEAAKQMLARGDQKIATTAAALGFFDQSHFTRTFRRMTGVSPRAFSHLHAQSAATEPATRFGSKKSR